MLTEIWLSTTDFVSCAAGVAHTPLDRPRATGVPQSSSVDKHSGFEKSVDCPGLAGLATASDRFLPSAGEACGEYSRWMLRGGMGWILKVGWGLRAGSVFLPHAR